jgi:von Willebrand factor type A domain
MLFVSTASVFISQLISFFSLSGSHSENNHPFNYNEGNTERRLQQKGFDIVFLVDESESMSREQASLKSHVPTIFNAMNAHSPVTPSKAGLVGFGGMNISHPHDGHTHIPLTTDQTTFQNAVNSLTLDGIEEPSIEFICKTIQGGLNQDLGFRTNTTFGIVLISDEPSNFDNPEYTMQRTIDTLNNIPPYLNQANAKGIFYGIVPFGPAYDFYKNISIATGGEMYDSAVFRTDVYPGAEWVLTDIITKLNAAVNHLGTANVILAPKSASCPTGMPVQLNAFVTVGIDPLAGIYVYFKVTSGPNKGEIGVSVTDATGKATWMFTNNGVAGNCTYEACIIYEGEEHCDSSGQPPR